MYAKKIISAMHIQLFHSCHSIRNNECGYEKGIITRNFVDRIWHPHCVYQMRTLSYVTNSRKLMAIVGLYWLATKGLQCHESGNISNVPRLVDS